MKQAATDKKMTERRKAHEVIQEAQCAAMHLSKCRSDVVKPMDAQNKWSEARKVMKETDSRRVSSGPSANSCVCARKARTNAMSEAGNALEAILRFGMKQMLKAVVEVQYTTGKLEVAG
jgi:hypothetical protein